ncbi:hypothetical protein CALCODRAFT_513562 [Calocera cornea HHB12733]|uniref:Uncharacterized protein n=1 Tax=Calocera cornea HHB12733 TaxID=1353952 RepID=A0A165BZD2_9BASI|nr:hypothetical protein CALCODRAFT_513562 [Calocera cornea HHB12733]
MTPATALLMFSTILEDLSVVLPDSQHQGEDVTASTSTGFINKGKDLVSFYDSCDCIFCNRQPEGLTELHCTTGRLEMNEGPVVVRVVLQRYKTEAPYSAKDPKASPNDLMLGDGHPFNDRSSTGSMVWSLTPISPRSIDYRVLEQHIDSNEMDPEDLVPDVLGLLGCAPRSPLSGNPTVEFDRWRWILSKYMITNNADNLEHLVSEITRRFSPSLPAVLRSWEPALSSEGDQNNIRYVALSNAAQAYIRYQREYAAASDDKTYRHLLEEIAVPATALLGDQRLKKPSSVLDSQNGVRPTLIGVFGGRTYKGWAFMLASLLDEIDKSLKQWSGMQLSLGLNNPGIERRNGRGACFNSNCLTSAATCHDTMPLPLTAVCVYLETLWTCLDSTPAGLHSRVEHFGVFDELLRSDRVNLRDHLGGYYTPVDTETLNGNVLSPVPTGANERRDPSQSVLRDLQRLTALPRATKVLASCYRRLPKHLRDSSPSCVVLTGHLHEPAVTMVAAHIREQCVAWICHQAGLDEQEIDIVGAMLDRSILLPLESYIHPQSVLSALKRRPFGKGLCNGACVHDDGRCHLYRVLLKNPEALAALQRCSRPETGSVSDCAICRWVDLSPEARPITCEGLGKFYGCWPFGLNEEEERQLLAALQRTCVVKLRRVAGQ